MWAHGGRGVGGRVPGFMGKLTKGAEEAREVGIGGCGGGEKRGVMIGVDGGSRRSGF